MEAEPRCCPDRQSIRSCQLVSPSRHSDHSGHTCKPESDFQFSTILTRWTDGWDYAWISSVINSINFSLMQLPRIFLAQSEDFQERGGSEKKCKKVFFEAVQSVIINLKGQFFKMKSFKKESDYDSRIWNLCFCNRRKARVCLPAIMEEPAQRALPAVILQTFFFIGSQNFSWEQLGNWFFLNIKMFSSPPRGQIGIWDYLFPCLVNIFAITSFGSTGFLKLGLAWS